MHKGRLIFSSAVVAFSLVLLVANLGNLQEKTDAVDRAQERSDIVLTECILNEGYNQCVLYCDRPDVKDPEKCFQDMNRLNEQIG